MASLAKKPSTALSHERRCRREVEGPPREPCQPGLHLRVFVGGVVVNDGMDRPILWHCGLGDIEKADELLMPVPLYAASDYLAVQHVEGREQGGRAMPLVVVGHGAAASLLHR